MQKRKQKSTLIMSLVVLIVLVGSGFYFYNRNKRVNTPPQATPATVLKATTVEVMRPEVQAIPLGTTAVGSLRSNETVVLRPEVAGRISALLFKEGQHVQRGQLLVQLDGAIQKAELQQALANQTLAQSKLSRTRDLRAKGFVSQQALDEVENGVHLNDAAVALAQARFAKTEIRAPFAGIIGLRAVSVGDYVKEGQDIVNLESMNPLKVDFRIPETYVAQSKVGQTLQITVDALPNKNFVGQVIAINPLIDANGRSIVLRAQVNNPSLQLRPGMFARVRLLFETRRNALLVSEQALVPQGDEQIVFRVEQGKAIRTPVEIGQRIGDRVEIIKGISKEDWIVIAGQVKLRDGMVVKSIISSMSVPNSNTRTNPPILGPNPSK